MNIELRYRDLEVRAGAREHAERQVLFHLSRFGSELTRVVLEVGDLDQPGLEPRCHAVARGPRLGSTSVEVRGPDASAAVELAVERLSRAVGRALDRLRSSWGPHR